MRNQKEIVEIIEPKKIIVGDVNAPVELMQFGDYESAECAKANEVVKSIMENFPGKVKFIFRHFPLLKIHQKAHKAAEAAIAAGQEGKFWEMHNEIFAHQRNLGIISLKSYAKEIGTTNKKFLDELISGTYGWHVQGDLQEGIKMGVTKLPAFFINGKSFEQEATLKNLTAHINSLLDTKKKPAKKTSRKLADASLN